jgi:hypothetical protein
MVGGDSVVSSREAFETRVMRTRKTREEEEEGGDEIPD